MSDEFSMAEIEQAGAFSQMILETIPGLFFVIDSHGHTLQCNKAFETLFLVSDAGLRFDSVRTAVDSTRYDFIKAHVQRAFDDGSATTEVSIPREGERRFFRVTSTRTELNHRTCVMGVGVDITDSKAIEALQAGQNRVLVSLATGESLEKVLTTLILAAEEQVEGMLGSIMLLDEEGLHLTACAAPSLPRDYVAAIAGLSIGPDVGSCGAAAFLRRPIFVESIESHPNWIKALELTRHHGLYACWSHPIFSTDNQVLGTFAMYYRKARKPNAVLLRIIESGAHLAGLAIERNRVESELKAAKETADTANRDLEQRVKERTAQLSEAHRQLLDAARQAGMAEVATGVLHNVGNVLNSVNVSSSLVAETLRKLKVASLAKIAALLGEHEQNLAAFMTTDSRGMKLPSFLAQLAAHLAAEQETVLKEVEHLQKNIEHIREIVNMQQVYGSSNGFIEQLDLRELLETALQMNTPSLNRHDVVIVREFQDIPLVPADKHKVLQILVNLITNALQAMKNSPEKILTLGIQLTTEASVRVFVRDTGYGVASENITRIFAHGFTTKTDGHGFGLHVSALSAKEMKGSLSVHSDGAGHGAIFTLELPLAASHLRAA